MLFCVLISFVLTFQRPRKRKRQSTRSEQSDNADNKDDDKSSTSTESSDEEVREKLILVNKEPSGEIFVHVQQ